jgi:hypothetical protein
MSESFHIKLSFSGPVIHEKTIFEIFSCINTCRNVKFSFSGPVVLVKTILKISCINTCRNIFPNYDSTRPSGTMILRGLPLTTCKFELFWPSCSWEDFKNIFLYKHNHQVKTFSLFVAPFDPWMSEFKQTWFCTISERFIQIWAFLVQWFLRRKFWK